MRWIWLLTVLLLVGCAETRGVNKELPMRIDQGGDSNTITMNIQLELESDTMGESGDPRISPQTSASLYGPSQAAGTEALMDDLKYVIEKWMDNRKKETTTTTPPVPPVEPEEPEEPGNGEIVINDPIWIENYPFHHTTTASSDGGKSLVMCPDETMMFDECSVGDVDIPFHGHDNDRIIYWNMTEEPSGDILCIKGNKGYVFPAGDVIVYGEC